MSHLATMQAGASGKLMGGSSNNRGKINSL